MSHDNPHQPESRDQVAGDKTRDTVPVRPQGSLDDASDKETDAATENADISSRNTPQRGTTGNQPEESEQLVAFLQQNNISLPLPIPDVEKMSELKKETPELYSTYVHALNSSIEADYIQRTVPYTGPIENAANGRKHGLIVVLSVLVVSTIALYLDHPWFAAFLTGLDVVGLAAVFGSTNTGDEKKSSSGKG